MNAISLLDPPRHRVVLFWCVSFFICNDAMQSCAEEQPNTFIRDRSIVHSFSLPQLTFVYRRSAISLEERKLSNDVGDQIPLATRVLKTQPRASEIQLIKKQLGDDVSLRLKSAEIMPLSSGAYCWHIAWNLFPPGDRSDPLPFEYSAFVRSDGTLAKPEIYLSDSHAFTGECETIISLLAIDDLTPKSNNPIDDERIRSAAKVALAQAGVEGSLQCGGTKRYEFSGSLRQNTDSKTYDAWAVHFREVCADDFGAQFFTVWVSREYVASKIKSGSVNPRIRRE